MKHVVFPRSKGVMFGTSKKYDGRAGSAGASQINRYLCQLIFKKTIPDDLVASRESGL